MYYKLNLKAVNLAMIKKDTQSINYLKKVALVRQLYQEL